MDLVCHPARVDIDTSDADLAELAEDEYDGEAPGKIPTTVLGPVVFLAVPALGLILLGCYALTAASTRSGALVWLPVGVVLGAVAVGLWRRSRIAHAVAHLIAGMVALTCVGLVVAVPIVWCLSQRDAKDWFGIR
jgi:hypothetical protein